MGATHGGLLGLRHSESLRRRAAGLQPGALCGFEGPAVLAWHGKVPGTARHGAWHGKVPGTARCLAGVASVVGSRAWPPLPRCLGAKGSLPSLASGHSPPAGAGRHAEAQWRRRAQKCAEIRAAAGAKHSRSAGRWCVISAAWRSPYSPPRSLSFAALAGECAVGRGIAGSREGRGGVDPLLTAHWSS
jgi:hypothetical protein